MTEYEKEKWVELYRTTLLELEHAKMAGRIGDARTEIAARIEKLHSIPGLHAEERQAIDDALGALRILEREGERRVADDDGKSPERNQIDSGHEFGKECGQKFPVPTEQVNQHGCDCNLINPLKY